MTRGRRKRKEGPRGFGDRPWKWPYNLLLRATGIRGRQKRESLNYVSVCISASIGLAAGLVGGALVADLLGLGAAIGIPAGLAIGCVAFDLTAEHMHRDRFYRP